MTLLIQKEVAERIAHILGKDNGLKVLTQSIDDVEHIERFDAVVVGSSVRADRPLANVRDFFAKNIDMLKQKHVALFAVCLAANNKAGRKKVKKEYLSQITSKYPQIKPISEEAFGGKIDFDLLNPVMQQLMMRVLEKTGIETKGTVDTRDWSVVESWADQLRKDLAKAA